MKIMSSSLPLLCFVQFVVLISALAVENATSEISLAENAILKLTEGI